MANPQWVQTPSAALFGKFLKEFKEPTCQIAAADSRIVSAAKFFPVGPVSIGPLKQRAYANAPASLRACRPGRALAGSLLRWGWELPPPFAKGGAERCR